MLQPEERSPTLPAGPQQAHVPGGQRDETCDRPEVGQQVRTPSCCSSTRGSDASLHGVGAAAVLVKEHGQSPGSRQGAQRTRGIHQEAAEPRAVPGFLVDLLTKCKEVAAKKWRL